MYPSVQLFYYLKKLLIFRPQFFVLLVYRFGQTSPEVLKILYLPTFSEYKREIFILGVLGFLQTTRSFPKIPEEV